MKKLLTVILVFTFVFSLSSAVFAEDPAGTDPVKEGLKADIKQLISDLNVLRDEHKDLHEQALSKRGEIKELAAAAKEAGETEKLDNAKPYREDVKDICSNIQDLREDKAALWEDVKAARTEKDLETIKDKLTQIIDYKQQIIDLVKEKLDKLDEIIAVLQ